MSAEWTFFVFSTVGTLALILAPDVWRKLFVESRFGRWVDELFTAVTEALERLVECMIAPAMWIARKVSRG